MKKIQIMTLHAFTVQGCIVDTDATNSGSNALNAMSGAMKGCQVQTTGKRFFAFFCNTE